MFAAYKIPHPQIPEVQIRIQCEPGDITPRDVFNTAINQACEDAEALKSRASNEFFLTNISKERASPKPSEAYAAIREEQRRKEREKKALERSRRSPTPDANRIGSPRQNRSGTPMADDEEWGSNSPVRMPAAQNGGSGGIPGSPWPAGMGGASSGARSPPQAGAGDDAWGDMSSNSASPPPVQNSGRSNQTPWKPNNYQQFGNQMAGNDGQNWRNNRASDPNAGSSSQPVVSGSQTPPRYMDDDDDWGGGSQTPPRAPPSAPPPQRGNIYPASTQQRGNSYSAPTSFGQAPPATSGSQSPPRATVDDDDWGGGSVSPQRIPLPASPPPAPVPQRGTQYSSSSSFGQASSSAPSRNQAPPRGGGNRGIYYRDSTSQATFGNQYSGTSGGSRAPPPPTSGSQTPPRFLDDDDWGSSSPPRVVTGLWSVSGPPPPPEPRISNAFLPTAGNSNDRGRGNVPGTGLARDRSSSQIDNRAAPSYGSQDSASHNNTGGRLHVGRPDSPPVAPGTPLRVVDEDAWGSFDEDPAPVSTYTAPQPAAQAGGNWGSYPPAPVQRPSSTPPQRGDRYSPDIVAPPPAEFAQDPNFNPERMALWNTRESTTPTPEPEVFAPTGHNAVPLAPRVRRNGGAREEEKNDN